jgi:hypothetical protein
MTRKDLWNLNCLIDKLIESIKENESNNIFIDIYTCIYNICQYEPLSKQLYIVYRDAIKRYHIERSSEIEDSDNIFDNLIKEWNKSDIFIKALSQCFSYLNNRYILPHDIEEDCTGYAYFYEMVYLKKEREIKKYFVDQIYRERVDDYTDNRIKNIITILEYLSEKIQRDLYKSIETLIIKDTKKFYHNRSNELIHKLDIVNYFDKVEYEIKNEMILSRKYLSYQGTTLVKSICQRMFYTDKIDIVCSKISKMDFKDDTVKSKITSIFRYYCPYPGCQDKIADSIALTIKDIYGIDDLIDLHRRYKYITEDIDRSVYDRCLIEYSRLINIKDITNDLLKYIDNMSEDNIEDIAMLCNLNNHQDIFQYRHKQRLKLLLLKDNLKDNDLEKKLILSFKDKRYISILQRLFSDSETSILLNKEFKDVFNYPIEVKICSKNFWNMKPSEEISVSNTISKLKERYNRYYESKYTGRKLIWQMDIGEAEVEIVFKTKKKLLVSTYQMIILELFNEEREISFKTFLDRCKIPRLELERHILSLAHPKLRILQKNPNRREIKDTDMFRINEDFDSKQNYIKVPLMKRRKETSDEIKEREYLLKQRKMILETTLVKIMKTDKIIKHRDLMTRIFKNIDLKVDQSDIKRGIERLIANEYIKRDCKNRATYIYIS